ncbi:MAG: AMP-binding protein, partial [Acidobacteriota bacterium]
MLELDDLPHEAATAIPSGLRTLAGALIWRTRSTPDRPACYQKIEGRWSKLTWQGLHDRARSAARGLTDHGVGPGDSIAILGPTHTDWAVYDFGGQYAGAITVGVYPRQSAEQVRYLLEHSEAKAVFVADEVEMATVLEASSGLDSLRVIVAWSEELAESFAERDARIVGPGAFQGEPLAEEEVEKRQEALDPDATAILIYTSGTTGPPKGAMISHRNILTLCENMQGIFPYYQDDLVMAFLPMAHATERCLAFYGRVSVGVPAAYATSVGSVIEELTEARPTVFGSVPRIFEKLYDRVQGEVEKSSPGKQAIFRWADGVARRRLRAKLEGRSPSGLLELQHKIGMGLVFSKIQARFGGRVRACITGAAPISGEILEFLWAIDMPILEAYGMTEATVLTHVNKLTAFRLGTVGRPIPTLECKIADDGEILIRGPLIFRGYLKNPEATAEAVQNG